MGVRDRLGALVRGRLEARRVGRVQGHGVVLVAAEVDIEKVKIDIAVVGLLAIAKENDYKTKALKAVLSNSCGTADVLAPTMCYEALRGFVCGISVMVDAIEGRDALAKFNEFIEATDGGMDEILAEGFRMQVERYSEGGEE